MQTSLAALIVVAAVTAGLGLWLGRRLAHQRAVLLSAGIRQLTAAMARAAVMERAEMLRAAESNGRDEARAAGAAAEGALQTRAGQLEAQRRALEGREEERAQLEALLAE